MTEEKIQLVVEDTSWRGHRGLLPRLAAAAAAARQAARLPVKSYFTILLTDDTRLKGLNRDFRGKNEPTNVLSFGGSCASGQKAESSLSPGEAGYIGDIALAYGVTKAEALAAKKRFSDHASHLVVHGVLHLAGLDHVRDEDAKVMELLETRILAGLGIAAPYERPS